MILLGDQIVMIVLDYFCVLMLAFNFVCRSSLRWFASSLPVSMAKGRPSRK
jgi:hypothetical protein